MQIRYQLQPRDIAGLAKRFAKATGSQRSILRDLLDQGIHVSHYRDLSTVSLLRPTAERHYDTLLQCAQQFGPNPMMNQVATAEAHLQTLLTNRVSPGVLQSAINALSEECFWETYARMYNHLMRVGLARDIFERHYAVVRGTQVLDVGSGTGILSNAEARNGRDVTAIEPQLSMRRRMVADAQTIDAKSTLTIVPTFFVPGFTLDNIFDHVVMRYVFYLFVDHPRSLQTAYDMLKVGGTIAISNPLPKGAEKIEFQQYLTRRRQEIAGLPLEWRLGIYDAVQSRLAQRSRLMDRNTLSALLENSGFRVTIMETFEMDTAIFIVGEKMV